jgi:hypothetical protein
MDDTKLPSMLIANEVVYLLRFMQRLVHDGQQVRPEAVGSLGRLEKDLPRAEQPCTQTTASPGWCILRALEAARGEGKLTRDRGTGY